MITDVAQRWRDRRASYRPAGEPIDTSLYEVAMIADDATPRAFVERHHYSQSYPSARFRFGLYRQGTLLGIAVFSHPCNDAVLKLCPGEGLERIELGRFVLLDDVPANGESWMLARCREQLAREGLVGVVSFSDPVPRTAIDGRVVHKGHIGNIYQASNAVYTGLATPRTLHLLPDGKVLNDRTIQKIRKREQGWHYGVELLVAAGARPPRVRENLRTWLREALAVATRKLRHKGNHRYLFGLTPAARRALPPGKPYPKFHKAA